MDFNFQNSVSSIDNSSRDIISIPCKNILTKLRNTEYFECYKLDASRLIRFFPKDDWVNLLLKESEQKKWKNLKGTKFRKEEWLIGRCVAKDSIYAIVKRLYNLDLQYSDIEIINDKYGRPIPKVLWIGKTYETPVLSISHTKGTATAIAGLSENGKIGIDIERIVSRAKGFERIAFDKGERAILSGLIGSEYHEWITRFWCSKEAVAKSLGRGLIEGPRTLSVSEMDIKTGVVKLTIRGKLAQEFPEFANAEIVSYTINEDGYILACSLCERE
jgi:phosphopantetheinyl transferase